MKADYCGISMLALAALDASGNGLAAALRMTLPVILFSLHRFT